ncbi:hypothetical protein KSC_051410 [Ktedonobacter sp. SOSP1-52]|nr:hypothetical protein KSC_051410 [Ktedonobacter sp. SOSP1-52]
MNPKKGRDRTLTAIVQKCYTCSIPAEYRCIGSLFGMQDLAADRQWRYFLAAPEREAYKKRFQARKQLPKSISTEEGKTRDAEMETCVMNTTKEHRAQSAYCFWVEYCVFPNRATLLIGLTRISRYLYA